MGFVAIARSIVDVNTSTFVERLMALREQPTCVFVFFGLFRVARVLKYTVYKRDLQHKYGHMSKIEILMLTTVWR